MRAVLQRVSGAGVTLDGVPRSSIGRGLLILLGITDTDTVDDIEWLVEKIIRLRIFADSEGFMNLSLVDVGGEVLVVSQFTLFASTRKGNRPSWSRAARPEVAEPLYDSFVERLAGRLGKPVQAGVFGADMQINLVNDGPVTLLIDTQAKE